LPADGGVSDEGFSTLVFSVKCVAEMDTSDFRA